MHRALNIAETCQLFEDRSVQLQMDWNPSKDNRSDIKKVSWYVCGRSARRRHARASPFISICRVSFEYRS